MLKADLHTNDSLTKRRLDASYPRTQAFSTGVPLTDVQATDLSNALPIFQHIFTNNLIDIEHLRIRMRPTNFSWAVVARIGNGEEVNSAILRLEVD